MKWLQQIGLLGIAISLFQQSLLAAGTVTVPDEANLRAALAGGGSVIFACDGTITLTNTLAITNETELDASGHSLTLSGNGAVQLITVNSNVALTLMSLTLADGLARGADGVSGSDGGPGRGGAVFNDGGSVTASNCTFRHNTALGGVGSSGLLSNGAGGLACGGAVYLSGGFFSAANSSFLMNSSLGGTGAVTTEIVIISRGGDARGGAIGAEAGTLQLEDCVLSDNTAIGGPGRRYNILGTSQGGAANGGAIYAGSSEVWLTGCKLSNNGDLSGKLSAASGGAVCQSGGTLHLVESLVQSNTAVGGAGIGTGGGGADAAASGFGGAVYTGAGSIWITNSTLSGNSAVGGAGYFFGAAGSGLGGGVFNAGMLQAANSTVFGNTARSGVPDYVAAPQGSALGGGLCNLGGSMALESLTLSDNSAKQITGGTAGTGAELGGGLYSTNGTTTLDAVIIANSIAGSNAFGTFTDLGHNLSSDASANFSGPGSLNNADPKLGPLDSYGGPTPTMALLTGSPAIDGGDAVSFPPTDQRGRARPSGSAPDIGAFESSPPFVIRGTVSGFTLKDEVSVGAGVTTVSTTNGSYSLEGLATNTYLVTPSSVDYLFLPNNRTVTVGPDQVAVNFKAYHWNALSLDDATNGVLHLVFAGTNSQGYRVLASSNLAQWFSIATNFVGSSNYFESFIPIDKPRQFYRTVTP